MSALAKFCAANGFPWPSTSFASNFVPSRYFILMSFAERTGKTCVINHWTPDGDKEFPTICGTGTEDYFCGAYNFDINGNFTEFSTPY
mgnify:CR=1 FL=1